LKLSEAIIRLITSQPPQSDDKANEKYSIDKLTRLRWLSKRLLLLAQIERWC
jgi:hypothetical protein